jgi:hypothetical protein
MTPRPVRLLCRTLCLMSANGVKLCRLEISVARLLYPGETGHWLARLARRQRGRVLDNFSCYLHINAQLVQIDRV